MKRSMKTIPAFAIIAALFFTFIGASPASASTYSGYTLEQARTQILNATNAARADAGLAPLRMTTRLNNIAQNWSETMASQQTMYHNPSYSQQYPSGWSAAAENVAYGYQVDSVTPAWVASPGHYANITRSATNYIGIGVALASNGQIYYTQNFAQYNTTPSDVIGGTTSTPPPPAPTGITVSRLSGSDRYSTAVEVSKKFPTNVPVVYVAAGSNFPDALSAAPAAAYRGGPLLLTPTASVPTVVLNEIRRLNPAQIVVVGGTSVVSTTAFNQLKSIQSNIRRDAGSDRYETSRIISQRAFGAVDEVYIATGANFPDALSGSASAGAKDIPVILVPSNGSTSALPTDLKKFLVELGVKKVTLLGGDSVVSSRIASDLKTLLGSSNVSRLSGTDRYLTSSAVNRFNFTSATEAYFAVGTNFTDALAGASLAGYKNAPLFLVQGNCVPRAVLNDLDSMNVTKVTLLGGEGVLSRRVASLTSC